MTFVRRYVDAFNKGDAEAMAANCADPTRVLDDWRRTSGGAYGLPGVPEHVHLHERHRSCASSRNVIWLVRRAIDA
jgi:hypothetical protein